MIGQKAVKFSAIFEEICPMIAPKSPVSMTVVVGLLLLLFSGNIQAQPLDLSKTTIRCVTTDTNFLLRTPEILQQEVEKRTGLRWSVVMGASEGRGTDQAGGTDIVLVRLGDTALLTAVQRRALGALPAAGDEGYSIVSLAGGEILIAGKDARGLLYGIGRLLRKLQMRTGSTLLPYRLDMTSTPASQIRGHQLAYRSKTNAYDAFTVARFDQYIRDLALFGVNSIEIAPPRTDDELTSPHMVLPPAAMIVEQSRICKSYGLDVWMWYPNVGKSEQQVSLVWRRGICALGQDPCPTVEKAGGSFHPDAALSGYHPFVELSISHSSLGYGLGRDARSGMHQSATK
jgi:hypothetical protein